MEQTLESVLEDATQAALDKRFDEAAVLLNSVLAQDAQSLRAHDLFGFVRFFQGRFAEAEAHCRTALEIRPGHPYALKGLGLCLARLGRLDEGVASLEQAIANKPEWADPYWDLAVVLHDAGRFEQALAVLERGAQQAPKRGKDFVAFAARLKNKLNAIA